MRAMIAWETVGISVSNEGDEMNEVRLAIPGYLYELCRIAAPSPNVWAALLIGQPV